jgi:hypothetical protein
VFFGDSVFSDSVFGVVLLRFFVLASKKAYREKHKLSPNRSVFFNERNLTMLLPLKSIAIPNTCTGYVNTT